MNLMYREKILCYDCLAESHHKLYEPLLAYAILHKDTVNYLSDRLIGEIKGPNGELKTRNAMGSNWGYHPSTSAELYTRIRETDSPRILDIGSAFGLDPIAVALNNKEAYVDSIDSCANHTERIRELLQYTHVDHSHFGIFTMDFLDSAWNPHKMYDIVVISALLHFYTNKKISGFLEKVYSILNTGGIVIISNVSDKVTPLTEWVNQLIGEWRHLYDGLNHLSAHKMKELSESAGFTILSNQYLGSTNDADMNNSNVYPWYSGGLNIKQCILHTVLSK